VISLVLHLLRLLPFLVGGHRQLALENLALRQQLAVYKRTARRPRLRTMDRLFWVGLAKAWTGWRQVVVNRVGRGFGETQAALPGRPRLTVRNGKPSHKGVGTMRKLMKVLHYLGLILFLGSILSYILISALAKGSTLANLVFALQVINAGVRFLTLPGLLLMIVTGVILTAKHYGFLRTRWLNIKHVLIVNIVVNTFPFILPAETDALRFAQASLDK